MINSSRKDGLSALMNAKIQKALHCSSGPKAGSIKLYKKSKYMCIIFPCVAMQYPCTYRSEAEVVAKQRGEDGPLIIKFYDEIGNRSNKRYSIYGAS